MGPTLALIISGPLCCLSFRHGLEGLVVFRIKAECGFRLNPCLEAGIKGEVFLTLPYCSVYLQTQSSLEEHTLVVIGNVSTLAGSDNIGAKQRNYLIRAMLCRAKLLKGYIDVVLSQSHLAME
jgi:hypothetical protein